MYKGEEFYHKACLWITPITALLMARNAERLSLNEIILGATSIIASAILAVATRK